MVETVRYIEIAFLADFFEVQQSANSL